MKNDPKLTQISPSPKQKKINSYINVTMKKWTYTYSLMLNIQHKYTVFSFKNYSRPFFVQNRVNTMPIRKSQIPTRNRHELEIIKVKPDPNTTCNEKNQPQLDKTRTAFRVHIKLGYSTRCRINWNHSSNIQTAYSYVTA